jgi:hypothetical protein
VLEACVLCFQKLPKHVRSYVGAPDDTLWPRCCMHDRGYIWPSNAPRRARTRKRVTEEQQAAEGQQGRAGGSGGTRRQGRQAASSGTVKPLGLPPRSQGAAAAAPGESGLAQGGNLAAAAVDSSGGGARQLQQQGAANKSNRAAGRRLQPCQGQAANAKRIRDGLQGGQQRATPASKRKASVPRRHTEVSDEDCESETQA